MNSKKVLPFKLSILRFHGHLLFGRSAADLLDVAQGVHDELSNKCYHDGARVAPDVDADSSIRTAWEAENPLDLPGEPASGVSEHRCLGVPEL